MKILVPIAVGELFDKISILEIKSKKIKNKENLDVIKFELRSLKKIVIQKKLTKKMIKKKYVMLKNINSKLWNIENNKRACESKKQFDSKFIELARKVYIYNDKRAKIKNEINEIQNSKIKEVKSHHKY